MKIALCFRFAQLFDYKLSRGAISSNYGKKFKGLKRNKQDTQRVLFHYRDKFPPVILFRGKPPETPKSNYELASLVFFKAKLTIVKTI